MSAPRLLVQKVAKQDANAINQCEDGGEHEKKGITTMFQGCACLAGTKQSQIAQGHISVRTAEALGSRERMNRRESKMERNGMKEVEWNEKQDEMKYGESRNDEMKMTASAGAARCQREGASTRGYEEWFGPTIICTAIIVIILQTALKQELFSPIQSKACFGRTAGSCYGTAFPIKYCSAELFEQEFFKKGLEQGKLVAGGSFGGVYGGLLCDLSVAVEVMRVFEESDIDALLKEFGREALIWRQLSHPNLLPFFGLYYFQQRLCLVSPWMENGHMRAFMKKKLYDTDYLVSLLGHDPTAETQILDVALGLEHLHAKGVVHGDLKGDNIFVTPSRRACITDFGLSSIITLVSSIQFTNSSKPTQGGTIRYQAPELHRGGHSDLRSDIYAFAGVAYELLTRTPPFSQPKSCSGTPSLDGLWNLLQNCWEEQPAMRPTAAQIVQRLMCPEIQAKITQSTTDWEELFTSRFRRYLASRRPLPSFSEFERIIFGDGY
ncbi:kinase-like domain-containing protein [Mycena rebaudengoi]|nr:kinase-like domain-containing protein [Mycena rebaudengoi]